MRSWEKSFLAAGTAMAIALMWAASQPGTGKIFLGMWHYAAHFATFALFGAVWSLGLPMIGMTAIVAGVVTFGFLHEAYEIVGHAHGFEFYDAIVNGFAAGSAAIFARLSTSKTDARPL